MILDEFTEVTGYHRKHAIRVLTNQRVSEPRTRAVRRVYQEAVKEALIVLWEASDRICGKRLKMLCRCWRKPWSDTGICSWKTGSGSNCLR